jgi:CysZ protein
MNDVVKAFGAALRGITHPKMLALAVWPMLIALTLWLGLAWLYWDNWSQWLHALITGSMAGQWLSTRSLEMLAHYSALLLLAVVLMPMIFVSAILVAALIEMPLIVGFVARRDYPALEKRRGGTQAGSLANALAAVSMFAVLWIVTLPLWLTGVLAPVITIVLSAYLNQRLFRYDALSDHATAAEYLAIVQASRSRLFLLGAALAVLYFVPLLNLLVPVLSGLAFTHFGLARLAELRRREDTKAAITDAAVQ